MNWRRGARNSNLPTCGRKFCSVCGRWRYLVDFDVHTRSSRGAPLIWQAKCKVCHTAKQRERGGYGARKPALKGEAARARARERQRARMADPETRARRLEYERIYKEAQRRAAGIPARRWGPRAKRHGTEREMVPVGPLRDAFEASPLSASDVARRLGWVVKGRGDTTRVMRALGLAQYDQGHGTGMTIRSMVSYEMAVALARALELDGVDIGL